LESLVQAPDIFVSGVRLLESGSDCAPAGEQFFWLGWPFSLRIVCRFGRIFVSRRPAVPAFQRAGSHACPFAIRLQQKWYCINFCCTDGNSPPPQFEEFAPHIIGQQATQILWEVPREVFP